MRRLFLVVWQKLPHIAVAVFIYFALSQLTLTLRPDSHQSDQLFRVIPQIAFIAFVGFLGYVLFTIVLAYLQPIVTSRVNSEGPGINVADLNAAVMRLETLQRSVQSVGAVKLDVSDIDRIQLMETIKSAIEDRLSDGALKSIDEAFAKRALQIQHWETLITGFNKFKDRLIEEANNLTRRTNVNLALGSITTVLAGVGLVIIVLLRPLDLTAVPYQEYGWKVVAHYVPRLSLIVFAEVFAFFFLRLYKQGLSDIKYYQNEITNVELKLTALRAALAIQDSETLKLVITDLSRTERNFVLKQGETTLELERAKLERSNPKDWAEQIAALVKLKTS